MAEVGFTELRRNLASQFDRVEQVVTRQNHDDLVILPRAELDSLRETLQLLGTPAKARRLLDGLAELDAGRGSSMT